MTKPERRELDTKTLALAAMRCRAGAPRLSADELAAHVATLPGWTNAGDRLVKEYAFANYHETMAFVNALAWVSHREDHHPDLAVGYNQCRVEYSTHAIGGLSENDFICAAKCDALFEL